MGDGAAALSLLCCPPSIGRGTVECGPSQMRSAALSGVPVPPLGGEPVEDASAASASAASAARRSASCSGEGPAAAGVGSCGVGVAGGAGCAGSKGVPFAGRMSLAASLELEAEPTLVTRM